jgi:3-phosphoshikimate 1-carboxyvinyltransferase
MNLKSLAYKVHAQAFDSEINIPSSKSYANRALIMGALMGNQFKVINISQSTDVLNLLSCFKKIGLKFSHHSGEIIFENSFPACEDLVEESIIELATGDGGTTNRFLLALLALGKKEYHLNPSEKMFERPIDDLIFPLQKLGVEINKNKSSSWLTVKGPIRKTISEIEVSGAKSSQFISALMMIFFDKNTKIVEKNLIASKDYVELTKSIIEKAKRDHQIVVPIDFSSASYPLSLALLTGSVTLLNCHAIDSYQADSKFIELIKKLGGDIYWGKRGLVATKKNKLQPMTVDANETPDLMMTLVFLASFIVGKSEFKNLEVLKEKESNRVLEILKMLDLFEVDYHFDSARNDLEINGKNNTCKEKIVNSARDHRIVMMGYLFLRKNSGGDLYNTDCIEKSFPEFLKIMEARN